MFSWCVDRQDQQQTVQGTREKKQDALVAACMMSRMVAGLSWHCPEQWRWSFVRLVILCYFWRLHLTIFHLRVFRGQEKHGHAVNTQGDCSQICCGESPRALGQRVPLGDQKTLTPESSAKHMWSCGSGVSVLCSSKVMPWAFARTSTERGSLFPCPLPAGVWQRHISSRCFLDSR